MKALGHVISLLDRCLSPALRQMETRCVLRARFLVFTIFFSIPCNFIPSVLDFWRLGLASQWLYTGLLNLSVAVYLLNLLRFADNYRTASRIFLVWIHSVLFFALWTKPTVYSLAWFWSPCVIVLSSLIVSIQGSLISAALVTGTSIGNLFWQSQQGTPWVAMDRDLLVEQLVLNIVGSCFFMAIITGVYEFLREATFHDQARQRLLAARHAHTGAVGELVGHVAHEVNNPLAILQGSATRLRKQLERNAWTHDAQRLLAHMQRSHERIIRVQQSLAVFSSGNRYEPFVSCDVRTIFKDVQLAMKPPAQAQQVQLSVLDRSGNSSLRCQPHQIVYVLCSLIQNALDAVREHPEPCIMVDVKSDDGILTFTVEDNGKGIDDAARDRIFQPFFTTKTGSHAQGLSLSVSRGILVEHGGEIRFASRSGATLFILQLPQDGAPSAKLRKGA